MPDCFYEDDFGTSNSGTSVIYYTTYENGVLIWREETPEQAQERADKAKQLEEDKENYPLFFLKEGIV